MKIKCYKEFNKRLVGENKQYNECSTEIWKSIHSSGDLEKIESKYNGKHLGVFDSIEDAVMAHDMAKSEALVQIANEYKGMKAK